MIELRKLDENRWEEYRDLRLEALQKDPIAFGSSYDEEKRLSEGDWRKRIHDTLFAVLDGRAMGMIAYIREDKEKTRHIAHIHGFYMTQEFRGRGIGMRLLEEALSQIADYRETAKIRLTVNTEQKAAVGLYKKCGFTVICRLRDELRVDGRSYDEFIMEKQLVPTGRQHQSG